MNKQVESSIDVNKIIDRLKEAENMDSDAQFARYINMNTSTLSMCRKRNSIDLFEIFKKFEDYSKSWIIDGDGPMYRRDVVRDDTIGYNEILEASGLERPEQDQFVSDMQKILTLNLTSERIKKIVELYIKLKREENKKDE